MTTQELIDYYAGLLIIQYADKQKAVDTIKLIAETSIYDMIPVKLYEAFDLELAVGAQLDVIGKYVGVSRKGKTFTSIIVLDDDDYKSLIKMAIAKNYSTSSLYDIQELLFLFFPGTLLVFDYKNMSMSYLFDASIGSEELAEMFIVNNLLPKPIGVQLGSVIYSSDIISFFGARTYIINTTNNTPFNSYTVYTTDTPWLSYSDGITA